MATNVTNPFFAGFDRGAAAVNRAREFSLSKRRLSLQEDALDLESDRNELAQARFQEEMADRELQRRKTELDLDRARFEIKIERDNQERRLRGIEATQTRLRELTAAGVSIGNAFQEAALENIGDLFAGKESTAAALIPQFNKVGIPQGTPGGGEISGIDRTRSLGLLGDAQKALEGGDPDLAATIFAQAREMNPEIGESPSATNVQRGIAANRLGVDDDLLDLEDEILTLEQEREALSAKIESGGEFSGPDTVFGFSLGLGRRGRSADLKDLDSKISSKQAELIKLQRAIDSRVSRDQVEGRTPRLTDTQQAKADQIRARLAAGEITEQEAIALLKGL